MLLRLLPALVPALLFLGGLLFAALSSARHPEAWAALAADPEFRASLLHTFLIASAATIISTILGLLLALALRRWARSSPLLHTLLQIPLAVPHLAMAAIVLNLLGQSGLLARLTHLAGLAPQPADFPELVRDPLSLGILLTYVLKETPFLALIAVASLRHGVQELESVAATLGASPWQRFRRVTLPLIAPSLLSGALTVFAFVFAAFEVPFLLGQTYPPMLGVLVQRRYLATDLADRPGAIAAGLALSALSAVFVYLYLRLSHRIAGERPVLF